jgi:signal transduction histidine kinase
MSVATAVGAVLRPGAIAVAVSAAAVVLLRRHQAEREAIRDARNLTMVEARDVVGPALSDAALVPGSAAQARLDELARNHVVDGGVVRLKIWAPDGTIVYSDDHSLIGQRFALGEDAQLALNSTRTFAEISDLKAPENRDEARYGKLLEVYLTVHTDSGRPLLFETYQRYDEIAASSHRIWVGSLPAVLIGLLLLYVVQAPLAYRLAARLRRARSDREQALVDALNASDRERRRIAADLHDGVVLGLAGVSDSLSATAERVTRTDKANGSVVARAAQDLRSWVRELRTLVVTIAPPKLHEAGLGAALVDLRGTLASRGIDVTTDVEELPPLDPDVETLAVRVAQEAVRNVVTHADASEVTLSAGVDGDVLTVEVVDDGRGRDASAAESSAEGGHGLALLTDLSRSQGGDLVVATPAGGVGTQVRLVVPTQRRGDG